MTILERDPTQESPTPIKTRIRYSAKPAMPATLELISWERPYRGHVACSFDIETIIISVGLMAVWGVVLYVLLTGLGAQ
jgi:hypothetical protein